MSLFDLSGVLESFSTGTYTVTRGARSYDTNGRLAATSSTFSVSANVQPYPGDELNRLPEGLRTAKVKAVYTTTELRANDSISIGGSAWQVHVVEPWDELGAYFRAVVTKDGN